MDSSRSERMKPLSIADYLDHLGRAAGEKAPPRQSSPFRPRSLPSPQSEAAKSRPLFDAGSDAGGAEAQRRGLPRRSPWAPKPVPLAERAIAAGCGGAGQDRGRRRRTRRSLCARPRGRSGRRPRRGFGAPRGRARRGAREGGNASGRRFMLNEYIEFEGAIRSGFRQIETIRRRRRHPHPRAVSFAAGRQARRGRTERRHRPAQRRRFAWTDQDTRP